jgi:predicted enzyme related to lactoylglutathione lyase
MFQALRRIHVAASDFARSRRFYGEILGLPEAGGFENDWVEFALGPVLLKLTPLRPGEVPARNQVAAIFSTQALEPTLQTLKERGVTVTRGPAEEFTGRSAEILDPDGYRIIVFRASELHPDEEWVPMSKVDEKVRQKLAARRQKEKGRPRKSGKPKRFAEKSRKGTRKSSARSGATRPASKRKSSAASSSRRKTRKAAARGPAAKARRAKAASRRSGKKR